MTTRSPCGRTLAIRPLSARSCFSVVSRLIKQRSVNTTSYCASRPATASSSRALPWKNHVGLLRRLRALHRCSHHFPDVIDAVEAGLRQRLRQRQAVDAVAATHFQHIRRLTSGQDGAQVSRQRIQLQHLGGRRLRRGPQIGAVASGPVSPVIVNLRCIHPHSPQLRRLKPEWHTGPLSRLAGSRPASHSAIKAKTGSSAAK